MVLVTVVLVYDMHLCTAIFVKNVQIFNSHGPQKLKCTIFSSL